MSYRTTVNTWDHFSAETVDECERQLSACETKLDRVKSDYPDPDVQIDIALYQKLFCTLREQLVEVRTWQTQPTLYLTLACVGLAEAMAESDPAARHERAGGLSDFLDRSSHNLANVPLLFREIGFEVISDTKNYLLSLVEALPELQTVFPALERFRVALLSATTQKDFLLPRDLLERVYRYHMACDMDIDEIYDTLNREILEVKEILDWEAGCLFADWSEELRGVPTPTVGKEEMIGLYRNEVAKLAQHCLEQGWISTELLSSYPVTVAPMPDFVSVVRLISDCRISPGCPPSGGRFYVKNVPSSQREDPREYSMSSAHATYPGHHLLDVSRWGLQKPCRRVVEQPVFSEGWSCFAEELMKWTGYFDRPADRLLLARRRLWRAVKGTVDIALQTGTMDIPLAVEYLTKTGFDEKGAISLARRYSLNLGYQQCYTIGFRRFLHLFDAYGRGDKRRFVQTVLGQGEIGFTSLERVLTGTCH